MELKRGVRISEVLVQWCWMFQVQHKGKPTVVEFDAD